MRAFRARRSLWEFDNKKEPSTGDLTFALRQRLTVDELNLALDFFHVGGPEAVIFLGMKQRLIEDRRSECFVPEIERCHRVQDYNRVLYFRALHKFFQFMNTHYGTLFQKDVAFIKLISILECSQCQTATNSVFASTLP